MKKTTLLKVTTCLAVIPALLAAFFLLPIWIREAFIEVGNVKTYLLIIFFSLYLVLIPYLYSLYLTFRLLIRIDQGMYYSPPSSEYLSRIGTSGYVIGTIFLLDLPFIYGYGDYSDAPGIIIIFGFLALLSYAIAIFANLLKDLQTKL